MRGLSKAEYLASFPIEGMVCGECGADDCLAYPAVANVHRPTTVCPNCSTPEVESYLRFAAERGVEGFDLKPIRIFPESRPEDDLFGRMQRFAAEISDEERAALETGWHATADGSDCTGEFGCADDGGVAYFEGGPKPSYALAMLFDFENFMRGTDAALDWAAVVA